MSISVANYSKQLPAELLNKAQKLIVRECDAEAGGRYVAYIDEDDSSYDVSLTLNKSGTVLVHDCDCGAGSGVFCRHRAALLRHVAEGRKSAEPSIPAAAKKKATAKTPSWVGLLEDASEEELRNWLKANLSKSKELELSFTHHFTALRQHFTPAEIAKATGDAIKAVIGKKRKFDRRDLAAIMKLWSALHQPIVDRYKNALADRSCFDGFHAAAESCLMLFHGYGAPQIITDYIEGLLQDTRPLFHQLKTAEAWDAATGYFLEKLFDESHRFWRTHYLQHLGKLVQEETSGSRGTDLVHRLAAAYKELVSKPAYNSDPANTILFHLLREKAMLSRYLDLIKPIRWNSAFNLELLKEYLVLGHRKEAVKICIALINENSKEEHNLHFLKLLKQLYGELGNKAGKEEVMARLLPLDFDFEDFLFLYEKTPDEERKQFRTKILTKARRAWGDGNESAMRFSLDLHLAEQSGLKAIGLIDGRIPYRLLVEYADKLTAVNKVAFISALLNRSESSSWSMGKAAELDAKANVPLLISTLLGHYTLNELKAALKSYDANGNKYRWDNFFARELRTTLDELEYPPGQLPVRQKK